MRKLMMVLVASAFVATSPASAQILPPVGGDDPGTLECVPGNARGNLDCSFSPGVEMSSQDSSRSESIADFCRELPQHREQLEVDSLTTTYLRAEADRRASSSRPDDIELARILGRRVSEMETNVASRREHLAQIELGCREIERTPHQRSEDGVPA